MALSGDWYNEFGSHMHLTEDASGGITGSYVSAAGHAAGTYGVVGRSSAAPQAGQGTTVAWAVAWQNEGGNAGSVTSWSGQYHADGPERIFATWLLTRPTPLSDTWESTTVGQDVFTREAPDVQRVEAHRQTGRPSSHP
ncbi:avidin/streptavidin family protein [Kitasatospora camelliae]|uniref:Avidin/streptavidin family protein n=1 Tax=Kitasatospora camelliae TaxID=3156397 RepID=A0AAU8JRE7_9ACTN